MSVFDYMSRVYGGPNSFVADLFGGGGGRGGASQREILERDTVSPAVPLENLAQRVEDQANQADPIFEQSLAKGLREQASATITQTEQAAGLTGAAQVQASMMAYLEQTGQAAMAAHARKVENERALLGLQAQLLGQAGQLREQRFETNQRHQEFLMQLKAQEDARAGKMVATIAGGALSAFAGGGFGGLLAGAGTEALASDTGGQTAATEGFSPEMLLAASQGRASNFTPGAMNPAFSRTGGLFGIGFNPYGI